MLWYRCSQVSARLTDAIRDLEFAFHFLSAFSSQQVLSHRVSVSIVLTDVKSSWYSWWCKCLSKMLWNHEAYKVWYPSERWSGMFFCVRNRDQQHRFYWCKMVCLHPLLLTDPVVECLGAGRPVPEISLFICICALIQYFLWKNSQKWNCCSGACSECVYMCVCGACVQRNWGRCVIYPLILLLCGLLAQHLV